MAAPHNPALTITLKLNRSKIVINVNSSFRAGAVEAHIRTEAVSLTTESIGSRADVEYEPRRTAPCPNGDVRCRLSVGAVREFQLLNRLQPRQMRRDTHRCTESTFQAEYAGSNGRGVPQLRCSSNEAQWLRHSRRWAARPGLIMRSQRLHRWSKPPSRDRKHSSPQEFAP